MNRRLATLVLLASATPVAAQWLTLATPGIPRTADGEPDLTERYHRPDFGHLQLDITYEDPGTFNTPLQVAVALEFATDDGMATQVAEVQVSGAWIFTRVQ